MQSRIGFTPFIAHFEVIENSKMTASCLDKQFIYQFFIILFIVKIFVIALIEPPSTTCVSSGMRMC